MDCWSAENATNAFLKTLKMGERGKAPDVTEFISAMAAGNNSQLMVTACSGHHGSTLLGLVAAAHQTGGRVVCILRGQHEEMHAIKETILLGGYANFVEFVIGDVKTLLASNYEGADFVLIDCELENFQEVFQVAQQGVSVKGAFIVGYNALREGHRLNFDHKGYFLPIGEGLLVSKISVSEGKKIVSGRRSHWVVEVDECTGEEHVYRVSTSPNTN
ncbi:hypothetical protein K7X08_009821 [Anisodus acutangulus]|uniref:Uncharacterized protein n=2 Tax=Anisodus TaxID=243963 RepID=A0A9Q1N409_9SOLA|nr:hypothetical protein K7X08_009821 [Anisodus acutangulus]KAK4379396.1 hypothetical protein RND71_001258 [Anisodus tanguticus]